MMGGMGFGEQGQQQSRDCAIQIGTVCRAPIRLSYFVGIFFFYQLTQIGKAGAPEDMLLWLVLQAIGNEAVLLLTVLCHEFGHGNMARYFGGEISHILLWVFGGICFHTRPPNDDNDNRKVLRQDLLVVAAGPSTHFLQAPFWGIFLWLLSLYIAAMNGTTGYDSAWHAFLSCLNPLGGGVNHNYVWFSVGRWSALLWSVIGTAIQLNVALFIFNVFFPMYPADGSKLLVTSLMFFCGVPPRRAAFILICCSVPCAVLMIAYAVYGFVNGGGIMGGLMGFMGVMSLQESKKIWDLRKARQLHTHSLFQIARSWGRPQRDTFGNVHRINHSELDDELPFTNNGGCRDLLRSLACCSRSGAWGCACLLPCFFGPRTGVVDAGSGHVAGSALETVPYQTTDLRVNRGRLLDTVEAQSAERNRTVREYMDDRYGGHGQPDSSGSAPPGVGSAGFAMAAVQPAAP